MYESGSGDQFCWLNVPMPLLPPLVEQKIVQLASNATRSSSSSSANNKLPSSNSGITSLAPSTGGKMSVKRLNKLRKKQQDQHLCEEGDDSLLFNGCLVATEFQSHWLANHYPQMLRPSNYWDEERRNYEKLLDIGTKLCRDRQFEHALRCFNMAVPPNAADHAYLYALKAVVKLTSEMYEDAVVDAATVMLIFLSNTMWHRLFPHFRLAFTNAHLVVAIAFSRLGYVSAAKAWADRFVCMSESLPGHDAESMLAALQLVELGDEVRLLHRTDMHDLANFSTIRRITIEDLKYHAQRVLHGGEILSSIQLLFSIVHISLNYGYFLTENYPPYRDEILINSFRFHMGLLELPVVARILSIDSAFDLADSDCQFFSILSRFLLLPMCYCMNHNVCEEMLTDPTFTSFLATIASELAIDNAAIVRYKTDRPCFALVSPVFSTILWAVWHRAPAGRSRLLAGVTPFNDITWHTDVLLAELGANGPPNAWLRLLDFFAVFYESFSVLPAFRAEIHKMPTEKLAAVINKLSWLWSALFQYSIGGCLATKEPFMESLEKASSDTSLVFWLLIAKDEHFLSAMVRSHFWLHVASHMEFMTKASSCNLLAPNVRQGRLKCIVDLLIAMLRTGRRNEWPPSVFEHRFFNMIAKCLADLLFVGSEVSHELPSEIIWLLLQLATLMAVHFPDEFPGELVSLCGQDYANIAIRLFSFLKQPPSEAIFKASVTCTAMLLRRLTEKIVRASKKLKLRDINALFAKLVNSVVSLHDLDWDEILMASACDLMEIFLSNERCSTSICSNSGVLFSSFHGFSASQQHQQERCLVMRSGTGQDGDPTSIGEMLMMTPPPETDSPITHFDLLSQTLTIFSEEIDAGKLANTKEADAKQSITRLLRRLADIGQKNNAIVGYHQTARGDATSSCVRSSDSVSAGLLKSCSAGEQHLQNV